MDNNSPQTDKPVFKDVSLKLLEFKSPDFFDSETINKILSFFRKQALANEPYLSMNELEKLYESTIDSKQKKRDVEYERFLQLTNWQKKDSYDVSYKEKMQRKKESLLKENLKLLVESNVIKSAMIVQAMEGNLIEIKKHFLVQTNHDLFDRSTEHSKNEITQFVLGGMEECSYPFSNLLSMDLIHKKMVKNLYFEANHILNQLIKENHIIKVPLLQIEGGKEVYRDFLFPGKPFRNQVNQFIDDNLIPALNSRYRSLKPFLIDIFEKHKNRIEHEDIVPIHKQLVYDFCFMILEAKNNSEEILLEDFNLAQLILNCWLVLEDDPLRAIRQYPNAQVDNNFLSPFLTQYLDDFSNIEDYLASINEFMQFLPQVIKSKDLIYFFQQKGVPKKVISEYLKHLPKEIFSIRLLRKSYYISKSQLIKAITYLYNENYYKTGAGQKEFEVLVQGFYILEQKIKDFNHLLDELKTSPEELNRVKRILKKSPLYRHLHKKKTDKQIESELPSQTDSPAQSGKKVYTADDLQHMDEEEKEQFLISSGLMKIECVDQKNMIHEVFFKKSELSFDDARFFRGNPTYELVCNRFNL